MGQIRIRFESIALSRCQNASRCSMGPQLRFVQAKSESSCRTGRRRSALERVQPPSSAEDLL